MVPPSFAKRRKNKQNSSPQTGDREEFGKKLVQRFEGNEKKPTTIKIVCTNGAKKDEKCYLIKIS